MYQTYVLVYTGSNKLFRHSFIEVSYAIHTHAISILHKYTFQLGYSLWAYASVRMKEVKTFEADGLGVLSWKVSTQQVAQKDCKATPCISVIAQNWEG